MKRNSFVTVIAISVFILMSTACNSHPTGKWAVSRIDHISSHWKLVIYPVYGQNKPAFEAEIEQITFVHDESLDGTYVSLKALNGRQALYDEGFGVTIYIRNKDDYAGWVNFMEKIKKEKKEFYSPRDIKPIR